MSAQKARIAAGTKVRIDAAPIRHRTGIKPQTVMWGYDDLRRADTLGAALR